jgi:plasmid stabilization system protein ParE
LRIAFSSAARRDRHKAEAWYRRRSPAALEAFIRELDAAVRFIAKYPEGAPRFGEESRAKTLGRFPYSVIYDVRADRVLVMAIVDERREPGSYGDHLR